MESLSLGQSIFLPTFAEVMAESPVLIPDVAIFAVDAFSGCNCPLENCSARGVDDFASMYIVGEVAICHFHFKFSFWFLILILKSGELLLPTPDQLTLFSGSPSVDALLVHNLADLQGGSLGLDSFADIDIVNTTGVPDADVALATHVAMDDSGYFFGSLALDARYADLPAGLILDFLAIAEGDALVVSQLADGADIDSTIGSVLHNKSVPFILHKN